MSGTLPTMPLNAEPLSPQGFNLVEMLLADQHSLTAVERFSLFHDQHPNAEGPIVTERPIGFERPTAREHSTAAEPAQAKYYRDLLPATPPSDGQQFAFSVDLDACSGCKACVVACHTMNGLEDDESWRRVGTLTLGEGTQSRLQHVTTACHHCDDPGCLSGCPVKAYVKDPDTGIVRHLDDQCIGCKYCVMMCPYEVPQFSDRLGIVRKCDMCHQRLSVGEAPACVQSCPNQAISIRVAATPEMDVHTQDRLVPGAPISSITRPSTKYTSQYSEAVQVSIAQDECVDEVAESHWPLAVMLVLTQVSVGMLIAERIAAASLWMAGAEMPLEATRINSTVAFLVAMVGMNLAPLHLGQPLRAWRVFLGLRTSWLSREAILLGKYSAFLGITVGLLWLPTFTQWVPELVTSAISHLPDWTGIASLYASVVLGVLGLFSSAMIYVATRRQLWRSRRTFPRFFGTAVMGGAAVSLPSLVHAHVPIFLVATMMATSIAVIAYKIHWDWRTHLGPERDDDDSYDRRTRVVIDRDLSQLRLARMLSGAGAIGLLVVALATLPLSHEFAFACTLMASVSLVVGEICERLIYFSSVVFDRMPGTL